jgi:hypothetical protein
MGDSRDIPRALPWEEEEYHHHYDYYYYYCYNCCYYEWNANVVSQMRRVCAVLD